MRQPYAIELPGPSTSQAPVAVDVVSSGGSTLGYQVVKLAIGPDGTADYVDNSHPLPVVGTINVGSTVPITGTINVSGTVPVTGTITMAGVVPVTGTINITPTIFTVNTAPTIAGASITIQGTITNINTVSTVLGTVNVNIAAAVVTVGAGAYLVTTTNTAPGIPQPLFGATANPTYVDPFALLVRVVSNSVNTVLGTVNVAIVAGSVTVIISAAVSISGIVPVTTAASVSVSGLPVWLNPTQTVAVSGLTPVDVSTAAPGATATAMVVRIAGTGLVSVVPGLSVSAVVSGTVTLIGSVGASIVAAISISNITPTSGQVGSSVFGIPVFIAGGQSLANPVSVTGNVSAVITGPVSISAGTIGVASTVVTVLNLGTLSTILGTQVVTIAQTSVIASVGSLNTIVGSTTGSSGNVGIIVWLGSNQLTQTITGIVTAATIGTVINVNTISTILGTQVVTIAQTSVIASISGGSMYVTNPASAASGLGVYLVGLSTTALSGVTGPVVWLGASQTILFGAITTISNVNTISTILGTQVVTIAQTSVLASVGSVNTVVGTTTATSGVTGLIVWLGVNQTLSALNTVVTVLSTVNVAIVAGAGGGGSVTTGAPSISATGQVMWIAGGQSTTAVPVFISNVVLTQPVTIAQTSVVVTFAATATITAPTIGTVINVNTISTILGTQVVTIAQTSVIASISGGSMYVTNPASAASGLGVYLVGLSTTALSGVTGPVVWLGASQTILFGAITTISNVNTISTILGTVPVTIVQTSVIASVGSLNTIVGTTTGSSGNTGLVVWLGANQQTLTVTGNLAIGAVVTGGYWYASMTTVANSSTVVELFSVALSTAATNNITGWTIGSGSVLIIYGLGIGISNLSTQQITMRLLITNTAATLSTVASAFVEIAYTTGAAGSTFLTTGFVAGAAAGAAVVSNTNFGPPWIIPGPAVVGIAFAATTSGASFYVSILAQVVNNIPTPQQIVGTVAVTVVGVSAVLGTIVTILGTQIVTLATGGSVTLVGTLGVSLVSVQLVSTAATGNIGVLVWIGQSQTISIVGTAVVTIAQTSVSVGSLNTMIGTTTATSGVTGLIVWLGVNQTISALNTVVTVLGTQIVTLATGGTVTLVGTVGASIIAAISISALTPTSGPVSSSNFGLPVFIAGGQSAGANPVGVSITVSAVLGTVVTLLGTINVNQIGLSNYVTNPASAASGMGVYIVGLSTTALSGVTGPMIWLGQSQTVSIGGSRYGKIESGSTYVWGQSGGTSATGPTVQYSISINGMTQGAAAVGTYVDLGSNWDQEYNVHFWVFVGSTAPATGSVAALWLINSPDATLWPGFATGTNTTFPVTGVTTDALRLLGSPVVQAVAISITNTAFRMNPVIWRPAGRYVAPVVWNNLGVPFQTQATASNNGFRIILEARRWKEQEAA